MTTINELYLKGYGYKKIAKELKISTRKVVYELLDLGYDDFMIFPEQKIQDQIIIDYNDLNTEKLARKYKMSSIKICAILKLNNVKIVPAGYHKDYNKKVNHDFFDKIDSEEKAYWLGFLYADGYNNTDFYQIEFALKEEDEYMVNLFKKSLSSTYRTIKKAVNLNDKIFYSFRHTVYSKKISKDLEKLGCPKNKSLKLKFPTNDQVPEYLISHFMRGYFDGDGCISGTKFMLNGTKEFLDKYVEILRKNTNISEAGYWTMDGKSHRWSHAGKKDLKLISNFLYKDSNIFLKRKYDRFNICPCSQ